MPRSSRYSHFAGELPRTLRRSCPEAQAVFLRASWEAAQVHGESEETYRIWLLYMAGCSAAFERGEIAVHQLLLSRPEDGHTRLPLLREDLYR